MKLISLREFQKITFLSDQSLLNLLSTNSISCTVDQEKGIMVDIDSAANADLIKAIVKSNHNYLVENRDGISERLGNVIGENLSELIDEAINNIISQQD